MLLALRGDELAFQLTAYLGAFEGRRQYSTTFDFVSGHSRETCPEPKKPALSASVLSIIERVEGSKERESSLLMG